MITGRLTDRDMWVLRQLRAKIGEWDTGNRAFNNVTAHESVLLLRTIDFAFAAEEYLRKSEREPKNRKQIEHKPAVLEAKEDVDCPATKPQI